MFTVFLQVGAGSCLQATVEVCCMSPSLDVVDFTTLWLKAVLAVSVHSDLLCIHVADVEYSKGVVKVSN